MILAVHIFGAVTLFLFLALSIFSILKKYQKRYKFYMLSIAVLGIFQVLSGVIVALFYSQTNFLGVCAKLGVYIAPILLVELILYNKVKELQKLSWQRN